MNWIKWILPILGLSMLATGCFIDTDDDDGLFGCTDGDGPIVTREVQVDDFDAIHLPGSIDVFLTQGSEQKVTVEGKENLIDELNYNVSGSEWRIDFDDCVRDVDEFNVYITIPNLREIEITGSGNVISENFLLVGDLDIELTGSGDVNLAVEAQDIDVKISGSGDIKLEGVADETVYRISGSGDVSAFDLECNVADINVSGSGDVRVLVNNLLKARISGSGDIFYRGNPTLDIDISGSGDVVDAN